MTFVVAVQFLWSQHDPRRVVGLLPYRRDFG